MPSELIGIACFRAELHKTVGGHLVWQDDRSHAKPFPNPRTWPLTSCWGKRSPAHQGPGSWSVDVSGCNVPNVMGSPTAHPPGVRSSVLALGQLQIAHSNGLRPQSGSGPGGTEAGWQCQWLWPCAALLARFLAKALAFQWQLQAGRGFQRMLQLQVNLGCSEQQCCHQLATVPMGLPGLGGLS